MPFPAGGVPRILIVDGSTTQAEAMRRLIVEAGFSVTVVADGLEALKAIRADPPDLVITDLIMPGMDGLALVEAVRDAYPFVPIVLVTSFGSEVIAARALRAGAASYVLKRDLELDLVPTVTEILEIHLGRTADQQTFLRFMVERKTRYHLESDPAVVAPLTRHLEEELAALPFCHPADLVRVGVALHQALTHAIEHGNLEIGPEQRLGKGTAYQDLLAARRREARYFERRVLVTATLTPSRATYVIRGERSGLHPSLAPDPTDHSNLARSDTRGLLLVRTFMDEFTFDENGGEITLIKGIATADDTSVQPSPAWVPSRSRVEEASG